MKLDRVTITGADESVSPGLLLDISRDFHFVEWGILVGSRNCPRFPGSEWFDEFARIATDNRLAVSVHLCGRWVRELLRENVLTFWKMHPRLSYAAQRFQLNFHGHSVELRDRDQLHDELRGYPHQFIFQVDCANHHLASNAYDEGVDAVPLYDLSGGAGILPDQWPPQMKGIYSGYAGGLGPDNLSEQLSLIAAAADGEPFWIDMETRVRSDGDRVFDLDKVRRCLEICAPFIVETEAAVN